MEKIYWIDALGNTTDLTNYSDISPMQGKSGHLMPTYKITTLSYQALEGDLISGIKVEPRTVQIPLIITASSYYNVLTVLRNLAITFSPALGDGYIRITDELGVSHQIQCRYVGGLEGADANNHTTAQLVVLQFYAADPYWYDISPTTVSMSRTAEVKSFFPIFPLVVSSSSLFGTLTINNLTGVPVYPVWKIYNQTTDIIITNITTGKKIRIIDTVVDTDVYEIDATTLKKSVLKNNVNAWDKVSTTANEHSLWAIEPGTNEIEISLTSISAITYLTLTYTWRHLTI